MNVYDVISQRRGGLSTLYIVSVWLASRIGGFTASMCSRNHSDSSSVMPQVIEFREAFEAAPRHVALNVIYTFV